MDNGFRIKVTLLLVLLLLLVAVIVFIIGGGHEETYTVPQTAVPVTTASGAAQNTGTDPSVSSAQTGQTYAQQTQSAQSPDTQAVSGLTTQTSGQSQSAVIAFTPVPTAAPVSTPAPTPVPTPEPTPDPQPAGTVLGSGSLLSATGSLLNIHADWTASVADEENVKVDVTVYVDHYQLHNTGSRSLFITLGDSTQSLDTADIMYDISAKTSSVLGAATFTLPLARYVSTTTGLHVKWNFGGVYGDGNGNSVDLSTVTCGGDITITR